MGLYDDLRKRLNPETLAAVMEQMGDEYDFNQVPYSRLQQVIAERNSLRDQIGATPSVQVQAQPVVAAAAAAAPLEQSSEVSFTQKDIDKAVRDAVRKKDAELKAFKVRTVALQKLRDAGCIDAELVYDSVKVNKDALDFTEAGELQGLDDQIASLKQNSAMLFKSETNVNENQNVIQGTGKTGGAESTSSNGALESEVFAKGLDAIFGLSRAGD
jgi:hypothetical protein